MTPKFNIAIQTYNKSHGQCPSPLRGKQSFPNSKRSELKGAKPRTQSEANWMPRHSFCLSCSEDIRHPLCPNCIAKAFLQWTQKFPEHHEIKHNLNTFMRHHNHIKHKSKKCIVCKKNVHVCPYCFTNHLYELIKEAGIGIRAMTEFLFIFNFDFEHKGYSQELEAYGGY